MKKKFYRASKNRKVLPNTESLEQRLMMAGRLLDSYYLGEFVSPKHKDGLSVNISSQKSGSRISSSRGLVGFEVIDNDPDLTVDPSSVRVIPNATNPAKAILSRSDTNHRKSSITIVSVGIGPFSVLVTPERGTYGSYSINTYLVGDADSDGTVDRKDLQIIKGMIRNHQLDFSNYPNADADRDGRITRSDLNLTRRNLGSSLEASISNPKRIRYPLN